MCEKRFWGYFLDIIELNTIHFIHFNRKMTIIRLTKDFSKCVKSDFWGYFFDRKDYCPRVSVVFSTGYLEKREEKKDIKSDVKIDLFGI